MASDEYPYKNESKEKAHIIICKKQKNKEINATLPASIVQYRCEKISNS